MGTRESRFERGRRRGQQLERKLLDELRGDRIGADISQRAMAANLGWSQTRYWRFENEGSEGPSIVEISTVASLLGRELSASLFEIGDSVVDRGHQELIARFRTLLSSQVNVVAEVPLPVPGDRRSWDLLLRLHDQLIGVEAETRIRDIQANVRRIRGRERDGGVDESVIVLSDTRRNRDLVDELRQALGPRFDTSPRTLLAALRAGRRLAGSGLVMV
jgi:transcriptional regulator with XRE-family HTH domain